MSLFLKSLKELPPFGQALGMVLDEADTGPGVAVLLPGAARLSGDDQDEVFHTGVILATLDNTAARSNPVKIDAMWFLCLRPLANTPAAIYPSSR
ncbi:hypothetical protein N8291_10605 [Pseudomonadales bacterium]|nr:hypothetical protein [Pseudomonadales bacterium]